jgi:hypothetical protein
MDIVKQQLKNYTKGITDTLINRTASYRYDFNRTFVFEYILLGAFICNIMGSFELAKNISEEWNAYIMTTSYQGFTFRIFYYIWDTFFQIMIYLHSTSASRNNEQLIYNLHHLHHNANNAKLEEVIINNREESHIMPDVDARPIQPDADMPDNNIRITIPMATNQYDIYKNMKPTTESVYYNDSEDNHGHLYTTTLSDITEFASPLPSNENLNHTLFTNILDPADLSRV